MANSQNVKEIWDQVFVNICNYVCYSPSKPAMERGLHERDRVGVQDFVLLEDYQSDEAFIDNLRKRFQENIIYVSNNLLCKLKLWITFISLQTYIGQVLISVNPYKQLPIYSESDIKEYRNKHFYEIPPHM